MKDLSGRRGWEYAHQKAVEDHIENLRGALEKCEGRTLEQYQYMCGKIHGLRLALKEMADARSKFKLDDDAD